MNFHPEAGYAASIAQASLARLPGVGFVSIDPIISLPGVRQLIADAGVPVIAVSPIIDGAAVKG